MNSKIVTWAVLMAVSLCFFATKAPAQGKQGKTVGPGVTWFTDFREAGPLNYNVMRVELGNPAVTVEAESGKDKLFAGEKVLDSVTREAEPGRTEIIGGVNADFWASSSRLYTPVGLLVADGMIYNMPSDKRSVFALSRGEVPYIGRVTLTVELAGQGKRLKIDRINPPGKAEGTLLYTPPFGSSIPPSRGTRYVLEMQRPEFLPNQPVQVSLKAVDPSTTTSLGAASLVLCLPDSYRGKLIAGTYTLSAKMPEVKDVVVSVCGGGPALVSNGLVKVATNEGTGSSFSDTKHPRTAVGFTRNRKVLYLVTVDGRQPAVSVGSNLEDLAKYMASLGCWYAMNLDGGGSTTMVVGGAVVNKPSDVKGPRTVANSLLVVALSGSSKPARLTFEPSGSPGSPMVVPAGATMLITVNAMDERNVPVHLATHTQYHAGGGNLVKKLERAGNQLKVQFASDPGLGSLKVQAAGATGELPVRVVKLSDIKVEPSTVLLNSGDATPLKITALWDGGQVQLKDEEISITPVSTEQVKVEGRKVTAVAKGNTSLRVQIGDAFKDIPVYVDEAKSLLIESFDQPVTGLTGKAFSKNKSHTSIDSDSKKEGAASASIHYFMEHGGRSQIGMPLNKRLDSAPAALGVWVFGDGKEAWLRADCRDADGHGFMADFTNGADGITWKDEWKHIVIPFTSLIPDTTSQPRQPRMPLTVRSIYLAQDQEVLKAEGEIKLDGLEALYSPR